ncbi:MAG: hypothetical protein ABID84_05545 [Chloroflexota bacterium]
MPQGKERVGCEIAQGLVGADGIVGAFPGHENLQEACHCGRRGPGVHCPTASRRETTSLVAIWEAQ